MVIYFELQIGQIVAISSISAVCSFLRLDVLELAVIAITRDLTLHMLTSEMTHLYGGHICHP